MLIRFRSMHRPSKVIIPHMIEHDYEVPGVLCLIKTPRSLLLTEWDCIYVCLQYKVDCVAFARNMLQVVIHNLCKRTYADGKVPWGQHGAHLGPVGPKWAPCWPHNPCYQGRQQRSFCKRYVEWQAVIMLGLDGSIIHVSLWNMADCKHI